jgi:hypothetical protein
MFTIANEVHLWQTNIMAETKNEYIGFRTTPHVKKLLEELAEQGYRTVSQQCDMIITQYLKKEGFLPAKPEKKPKK